MTMGPEPMTMIRFKSVLLGIQKTFRPGEVVGRRCAPFGPARVGRYTRDKKRKARQGRALCRRKA